MALGTWIKFTKSDGNWTNDDLMHGEVVTIGEQVKLPLKKGQKVVISTVKKMQDLQEGKTYYYVQENQVMDILS